jgi:hypothetical protein
MEGAGVKPENVITDVKKFKKILKDHRRNVDLCRTEERDFKFVFVVMFSIIPVFI